MCVIISECIGLDPGDPRVEEKIQKVLHQKVNAMILEAREQSAAVEEAFPDQLQVQTSLLLAVGLIVLSGQ